MAIFNENEFYPILRESIRLSIAVPFDCYLRLSKNNRIIRFLQQNNIPVDSTFDKLKEHNVTDIYIRSEDFESYKNYIRQFFQTDEGKKLAETFDQNAQEIKGIPADMLNDIKRGEAKVSFEEIFSIDSILKDPNNPLKSDEESQIKIAAEKINFQLNSIFDPNNSIGKVKWDLGGGTVVVKGRYDINDELTKITSNFNDGLFKFSKSISGSSVIKNDDIIRIRGAMVDFINDEIHRINTGGGANNEDIRGRFNLKINNIIGEIEQQTGMSISDGIKSHINNFQQKLTHDIFKIKDYAHDTDPAKDLFIIRDHRKNGKIENHQHFKMPDYNHEKIQEQIGIISMIASSGNSEIHKKLKKRVKEFKDNLLQSKLMTNNESDQIEQAVDKTIFSKREEIHSKALEENIPSTLLNFIEGIKKVYENDLTAKNFIDDEEFSSFETPDEVAHFFSKVKFFFGNNENTKNKDSTISPSPLEANKPSEMGSQNGAREKLLHDIVEKQKKAILIYQNKIKVFEESQKSQNVLNFHQGEINPNLDSNNNISEKKTTTEINETLSPVVSNETPSPVVSNETPSPVVSNETPSPVVSNETPSPVVSNETPSPVVSNETPSPVVSNVLNEKDKIIEERDQLKSKIEKLEQDQKLLTSENKSLKNNSASMETKLIEFEQFVNSHVAYIDSIEKENQAFHEAMSGLKKTVDNEQFKNEKLEDLKRDNETTLDRHEEDIKNYQLTINDLRVTVGEKEKEIEMLSQSIQKLELGNSEEKKKAEETIGYIIKEKDKQINKMQTNIDANKDIIRSLNKDIGMLKNHNDDVLRLKKKLGDQLAEVALEKTVFKKKEESLNSKVIMLTNLNQQTRKTISRLTVITEQLRKDKMTLATEKAGNDNAKEQLGKTISTLKSTIRAVQQKEQFANKTIEKLNLKVAELQKQFAEETKKTFELERKVRSYKIKAS